MACNLQRVTGRVIRQYTNFTYIPGMNQTWLLERILCIPGPAYLRPGDPARTPDLYPGEIHLEINGHTEFQAPTLALMDGYYRQTTVDDVLDDFLCLPKLGPLFTLLDDALRKDPKHKLALDALGRSLDLAKAAADKLRNDPGEFVTPIAVNAQNQLTVNQTDSDEPVEIELRITEVTELL